MMSSLIDLQKSVEIEYLNWSKNPDQTSTSMFQTALLNYRSALVSKTGLMADINQRSNLLRSKINGGSAELAIQDLDDLDICIRANANFFKLDLPLEINIINDHISTGIPLILSENAELVFKILTFLDTFNQSCVFIVEKFMHHINHIDQNLIILA